MVLRRRRGSQPARFLSPSGALAGARRTLDGGLHKDFGLAGAVAPEPGDEAATWRDGTADQWRDGAVAIWRD
jgi:hypothetical protein